MVRSADAEDILILCVHLHTCILIL